MPTLITGSNGYLGFRIVVENSSFGFFKCFDKAKPIDELNKHSWNDQCDCEILTFVEGDIRDAKAVKEAATAKGHEVIGSVIHLAFLVGGPACRKDPKLARSVAIEGTKNVVEASKGKHLIFASSDAVYGNNVSGLCDEDTPCNPSNLYGQLKLECEEIVRKHERHTILRLPTNFGYSAIMRWDVLVHYLARKAFKEKKIPLSQGEITRTLAYVGDSAKAFHWVKENPKVCYGKTFNVASGAWKKREIADKIAEMFDAEVVLDDWRDPDARDFILDCSALQKTGWMTIANPLSVGLREVKMVLENEERI